MIRLHRSLLRALRGNDPARARTALAADLDRGRDTLRALLADQLPG
jgi:DNA-binding GntR family transcriptional regulator